MIKLKEAVIVEGKYDKIRLSAIVDAVIVETGGFQIFKDKEKVRLIQKLAEKNGIIVLTDSDNAGFMIRGKLASIVPKERIKHAYIPDILGKERRKAVSSREGKLGVEGMETEVLKRALEQAGVLSEDIKKAIPIDRSDLYAWGFYGRKDSKIRRTELLKKLGLPENMNTNMLCGVISALYGKDEFIKLYGDLLNE